MSAATRRLTAALSALVCLAACSVPTPDPRETREQPVVLPDGFVSEPVHPSQSASCVSNSDAGLSLNPAALPHAADGTPLGPKLDEIRAAGRLVVGVSQTTPLISKRDLATGKMEGLEVDVANGIAKELFGDDYPAKLSLVTVPTDRRLYTLDTAENRAARAAAEKYREIPEVDMVIADVSVTCARVDLHGLKYSAPYFATDTGLMVRRGDEGIRSLDDLAERKVCAGTGTTNIDEILKIRDRQRTDRRAEVIPVSTSDTSDCLMLLQRGLVDAIFTDVMILEGFRTQDPGTIVLGYRAEQPDRVGVAMAKQDEDLIRFVNGALEGMRADGSMERSRDKWYPDSATRPKLLPATYLD
ncbi:transporter substrate-binding domain-containing protein [Umezawaea sp. Da 62-37]|uniref:transporter substrate-binding domain-containing protein n=1 Tax=Umezawaea sp. Da 62-37 TaxID=3075927 RepID=UPI0028F746E4|nr:transporter substrate-binding domain-containing protein [Umezawaea sp. Da 62-37]WNV86110.1 transporter substrate-binding domain-containing protein [Umezawaea sp. Da 62-37]